MGAPAKTGKTGPDAAFSTLVFPRRIPEAIRFKEQEGQEEEQKE